MIEHRPRVATIVRQDGSQLERETMPAELLPPLDIPQPTQALDHVGRHFAAPVITREQEEDRRGAQMLAVLLCAVAVIAAGLGIWALTSLGAPR